MVTITDYFRNFHTMSHYDDEFVKLKHRVVTRAREERIIKVDKILKNIN